MDTFSERTYGLAGMFQAASLVQQLARTGEVDRFAKNASLNSVLILDAINTLAVYSDKQGIRFGLKQLELAFDGPRSTETIEVFQYVAGLAQLAVNMQKDDARMHAFTPRIEALSGFAGEQLVENMADVYKSHISDLEPRILVNGEQGFLAKEEIAQQVRALLLAGIRSAFLWQQKGGSRWDFMFKRKKYAAETKYLLQSN